jgi:hypothetical protein
MNEQMNEVDHGFHVEFSLKTSQALSFLSAFLSYSKCHLHRLQALVEKAPNPGLISSSAPPAVA